MAYIRGSYSGYRYRRTARSATRRYVRRGRRGGSGMNTNFLIGAALGYVKPVTVHPMQDIIITALAVSPVKLIPKPYFQYVKGYAFGNIVRAIAPGFMGINSQNNTSGDYV